LTFEDKQELGNCIAVKLVVQQHRTYKKNGYGKTHRTDKDERDARFACGRQGKPTLVRIVELELRNTSSKRCDCTSRFSVTDEGVVFELEHVEDCLPMQADTDPALAFNVLEPVTKAEVRDHPSPCRTASEKYLIWIKQRSVSLNWNRLSSETTICRRGLSSSMHERYKRKTSLEVQPEGWRYGCANNAGSKAPAVFSSQRSKHGRA